MNKLEKNRPRKEQADRLARGGYDVLFMNPPYDNGTYKQYISAATRTAKKSVTIHPTEFLLGKKQNKEICNAIKDRVELQTVGAMTDFDAGIWGSLGILTHTGNGKLIYNKKEFDNIEDIKPWSDDDLLTNFVNIVKPYADINNLDMHIKEREQPWSSKQHTEKNPNPNWICVKIATLRGHQTKTGVDDDYYTIIPRNIECKKYSELNKYTKTDNLCYFAFTSEKDCNNFINYIKGDFARACLRAIKTTGNLFRGELKFIPWFDFSDPHFSKSPKEIDDYLFKKFNISDEIRKHIEEILPDYYNIR